MAGCGVGHCLADLPSNGAQGTLQMDKLGYVQGWAADLFSLSLLTRLSDATVPTATSTSWGGTVNYGWVTCQLSPHLTQPLVGTLYFVENSCYVFANRRQNHDLSLRTLGVSGVGWGGQTLTAHTRSDTMASLETHTSSPAV